MEGFKHHSNNFEEEVLAQESLAQGEGTPSNNLEEEFSEEIFVGSPEQLKDFLFDDYMKDKLVHDYFEDLLDSDTLSEEEVTLFNSILQEYGDDAVYATLSLPKELREVGFTKLKERLEKGGEAEEVLRAYVESNAKYGFGVGYHTSATDIKPVEKDGRIKWDIKGTENDHRDDDLSRAYYSTKYRHLYKEKNPQWVYIVRTSPDTSRTDGNWSRDSSLSVVARVPYGDVVNYVESTAREEIKKATEKPEAA